MTERARRAGRLEFGPAGARVAYGLGLMSVLKALSLVLLADALATGIVAVLEGNQFDGAIMLALIAATVRGAAAWGTQVFAARCAFGAKEELRRSLLGRAIADGTGQPGALAALATRGLDDLDKYYTTVLPALMGAVAVPLLVGARILAADWLSALVIVLTVPLVPLFMALIGMHTRDRVEEASATLARLSDHLVELARGLPVLVGLDRVEEQTESLARISDDYRRRTMHTMKTAFLSALALELISTLSVAIVAVFIGFRLVEGTLPLEVGLLVLILAPECYAPLRDLGTAYHAAQDGALALEKSRAIVAAPAAPSALREGGSRGVRVVGLVVSFPDREREVRCPDFLLAPGEIGALCGPSGSGKSTILAVLANRGRAGGEATVDGDVFGIDPGRMAWVPQHPHTVGDTVLDELRLYADGIPTDEADTIIGALLERLGLSWAEGADPAQLSPGELRRLAFARGLLRVEAGATLMLLDEPTAHLDAASALVVETMIGELAGRVTILMASHESAVTALADRRIELDGGGVQRADTRPEKAADAVRPPVAPAPVETTTSRGSVFGLIAAVAGPSTAQFALAVLLGTLATLFAMSLTALSGWLIVRASEQPPIMYLLVAVVGVRFFGIGRSVVRYAERLVTHDAVFVSVTRLRTRLWQALAANGPSARALLRGGTALDYVITSADQLRDLAPRVVLPPLVGAASGIASLVAVALLHADAVATLALCLVVGFVVAPALALAADRSAAARELRLRSAATRQVSAALAAAGELRSNGADILVLDRLHESDRVAGAASRRTAWSRGLGQGVAIAACCATSAAMLGVTAPAVAAGTLPGEIVAVLVLLPLALIEPILLTIEAVQQWPGFAQAARKVAALRPVAGAPSGVREVTAPVTRLGLHRVSARWPGASAAAFSGVSAEVVVGDWLVVTGPSGSGKSTLLTLLLGYLAPAAGVYRLGDDDSRSLDARSLRRHVAWCPQESHLFDSTIRGNLLLARPRESAPDEGEMTAAMRRVGLGALLASLPSGLDTRIGQEGAKLSGGQRQRLAVARTLLARAEVVLLDEPTAHLDALAAAELMSDLREALHDRITVLVTHHPEAGHQLSLGSSPVSLARVE